MLRYVELCQNGGPPEKQRISDESARRLESNRILMKRLLLELAPQEGLCQPTNLDGVQLDRTDQNALRPPVTYTPKVYFLVSGCGVGYLGDDRVLYTPDHYVILATPSPFQYKTEICLGGESTLGISVRIDPGTLAEMAYQVGVPQSGGRLNPFEIYRDTPLTVELSDAVLRLILCLRSKIDSKVLGPTIIGEIIYRVLNGPQSCLLLSLLKHHQHLSTIHSALQWIHGHYAKPFSVPGLANRLYMSISAFQHSFKEVTGSSPLQYVKCVRLHRARMLIRHDGLSAAAAATIVGYESASQFSREFKRFFGHSYTEDRELQRPSLHQGPLEGDMFGNFW